MDSSLFNFKEVKCFYQPQLLDLINPENIEMGLMPQEIDKMNAFLKKDQE